MINYSKNRKTLFLLLFIILISLQLEVAARVTYYLKYQNISYLITPFCKQPAFYAIHMDYIISEDGKILYYKFNHKINQKINTIKAYFDDKEYVVSYYINRNGFRNREIKLLKDRHRIICLGSSATAGIESPDGQTWPAFLERFLSKYDVEVINMGIDGYNSSQVLRLYTLEAYAYKPDIIILYFGRNDVYHNHVLILNSWYGKIFYRIHRIIYHKLISYTYLVEKIRIFVEDYLVHGKEKKFLFYGYNPYAKFIENFKNIIDFSKKHNIKVIYICEIPNYRGDAQYCLNLLKRISNNKDYNESKADIQKVFIMNLFKLQEDAKDICSKYDNVQFVDGRAEFYEEMLKSSQDFFLNNNMDNIHLTPRGNEVLAKIISKRINLK